MLLMWRTWQILVRDQTALHWVQIAPAMRAHALLPRVSGRVAVTHVNMSGRMLIGLHLFSRAPGIKGVDMSFVHPPEVDMKFSPFGLTITEMPGILTALKVCDLATSCCLGDSLLHSSTKQIAL